MDDTNIDFDKIEDNAEEKLKAKNRFEKLSEKVIITSKERDDAIAKAKSESDARISSEKERDFYKDFSANSSKYPNASQFQDKIFEKVKAGYSTEDAMVSVLAKEGKLTSEPIQQRQNQVEGGSAPTNFEGNKSIQDMTIAEKLSALTDADKTGELANALLGR